MENNILTIIKKHHISDLYVSPSIPSVKLNNAVTHYSIPQNERVLGLIDTTVFGSAKTGIAIGLKGIYWKNSFHGNNKTFISWSDLGNASVSLSTESKYDVLLGGNCTLSFAGSTVKPCDFIKIANDFKKFLPQDAALVKQQNTKPVKNIDILTPLHSEEFTKIVKPYPKHYAANKEEMIRCYYSAVLLMVLLNEKYISEQQQQMLDIWLPSIGLTGRQAELCGLAVRLTQDQLSDAIKLFQMDEDLVDNLLLDIMFFTRLDKPLGKETTALLEKFAVFFDIGTERLSYITCQAALILGLPTDLLGEPLFNVNYPDYQFKLGTMCQSDSRVPQNDEKAAEWFCKAAEQGYAEAQASLALMFQDEIGVPESADQAEYWFRKAAEQGHEGAQLVMALIYDEDKLAPKDYEKAANWLHKAAEQGYAGAQACLAFIYVEGIGVLENRELAADWFRKAAEQGHVEAQASLGFMYQNGIGVPENDGQAEGWFRKAAEQGHEKAQFVMMFIYNDDKWVPENDEQAEVWVRKAAEQGIEEAQFVMAFIYDDDKWVPESDEQAEAWFRKAAEQGIEEAQFVMVFEFNEDEWIPKNKKEAADWFRKAEEQGYENAQPSPENMSKEKQEGSRLGATAKGAAAGAAIGSIVPVIGTTLGATLGGLAGYFGSKK